jgi:predicted DNA-binding transcriptional regulator AlpA
MEETIKRELLSIAEVAKILDISERTIRNRTGPRAKTKFPIPVKRIGRLVKFRRTDVEEYLAK